MMPLPPSAKGHETMVHFTLEDHACVARLDASATCRPGEKLALALRPASWHIFAATEEGERLGR